MDTAECVELNDKRETILNAAIRAFSDRGFYRTRITDIARAAKVADGTVYLYFESKEHLLTAIFNESMKSFMDWGRKQSFQVQGTLEKLQRMIEIHLETMGQDRQLATVFQVEMRHSSRFMKETSRAELRDYFAQFQNVLEAGKTEGLFRSDLDCSFASKCIFALLDEAATNWVLSENDYPLASATGPIMDFIMNGLK